MANFFSKLFRYMSASANQKLDEKADPRVQIEQAIQDAQQQHQVLVKQAASVLGNRRQLEMKLARQLSEVEKVQESTRQSLVLADQARASGDIAKANQYEQTAQQFATQLIAAETSVNDLKTLHDQALQSAEAARAAVEDNEMRLRNQLAERSQLLTQLEHAKMQEQMSASLTRMSELQPAGDTPTLAQVRDKIEKRYATALGQHELASQGVEARMLEVRKATMDAQASNRLAEIRAGLAAGAVSSAPAVTGGTTPSLEKGASPALESGQGAAAAAEAQQQSAAPASPAAPATPAAPAAPPQQ